MSTNITVEMLLSILNHPDCMTVAGFNGSCERVIRFDHFVKALEDLRNERTSMPEPLIRKHAGPLIRKV